MNELLSKFAAMDLGTRFFRIGLLCLVFFIFYTLLRRLFMHLPLNSFSPQSRLLCTKSAKYLLAACAVIYALDVFGISVSTLLGAAGIAGIAVGFAAQTSFSNIISGFFLLSDKALKIGDYITVDEVSGVVDSIDMLSVKIHTLDNQMVRIPNETIIKSNMINNTAFDIRRLSVPVAVGYDADIERALEVLTSAGARCPLVLAEPEPFSLCDAFGDSGVHMTLAVWFYGPDRIAVRNAVFAEIKRSFDEEGIPFAHPRRDLRFGPPTPHEYKADSKHADNRDYDSTDERNAGAKT